MGSEIKNLLDKLSSYNLFNYLLPGVIFIILANETTHYSFIQQEILIGVFLYYFIGIVISRFGSLAIEPFLKWISFIKLADYKNFIEASKKDVKIELLSEVNNIYRTLCSLFTLLLLLNLYEKIEGQYPFLKQCNAVILMFLLLVMFLLSYRKQTCYITKRIISNQN